jgi:hypothetical protein
MNKKDFSVRKAIINDVKRIQELNKKLFELEIESGGKL